MPCFRAEVSKLWLWARSGTVVFVDKVLLEHSHTLWLLLWQSPTPTNWPAKPKILSDSIRKSVLVSASRVIEKEVVT